LSYAGNKNQKKIYIILHRKPHTNDIIIIIIINDARTALQYTTATAFECGLRTERLRCSCGGGVARRTSRSDKVVRPMARLRGPNGSGERPSSRAPPPVSPPSENNRSEIEVMTRTAGTVFFFLQQKYIIPTQQNRLLLSLSTTTSKCRIRFSAHSPLTAIHIIII